METSVTQIRSTQELGERTQIRIRNASISNEMFNFKKTQPKGTHEQRDRAGDTRKKRQKGAKLRKLKLRSGRSF